MHVKILILGVFVSLLTNLSAQEQIGSRLTNFSGSQAFAINPAFAASALDWDVNLVHVSAFASTDYAYFPQSSLAKLLASSRPQNTIDASPELAYAVNRQADGSALLKVQGPSFFARAGSYSFGFSSTARVALFAEDVDRKLGYHAYAQIPVGSTVEVEPLSLGGLAWMEYGLYVGKTVFDSRVFDVKLGGHLKYLRAYESVYFESEQSTTFVKGEQVNTFSDMDVLLAYTANDSDPNYAFGQHKSGGIGADVGISIEAKPNFNYGSTISEQNSNGYHYQWKLGMSLLDVGRVSFDEAAIYRFEEVEPVSVSEQQIENVDGLDAFAQLLIDQAYQGDASQAIQSGPLNLWTPAALSIQYDRYLNHNFYFNALLVRRLPIKQSIKRANIVAGTFRYERKFMGVSIPIVLYNDRELRVGTAIRMGWFEVGSDDLLSFIGQEKLNGSDFYAGVKINNFNFAKKGNYKQFLPAGKEPPCPEFN